jgi:hypothetical protein
MIIFLMESASSGAKDCRAFFTGTGLGGSAVIF